MSTGTIASIFRSTEPMLSQRNKMTGRTSGTRALIIGQYVVGFLLPIVADAASVVLAPALGDRFPLIPFYPAIMAAAWYGGIGPGLLATATSCLLVDYL